MLFYKNMKLSFCIVNLLSRCFKLVLSPICQLFPRHYEQAGWNMRWRVAIRLRLWLPFARKVHACPDLNLSGLLRIRPASTWKVWQAAALSRGGRQVG